MIQKYVAVERSGRDGSKVEKGKHLQAAALLAQLLDTDVKAVVKEYDPAGNMSVGNGAGEPELTLEQICQRQL